jgi:hypothetical protein
MAFKDGRLNPQDKSRLRLSWWNWYKFICEVVPKHDGGKLGKKMGKCMATIGKNSKCNIIFFFSRIAMSFPIFQLGPSLSLWKLEAYNCMILVVAPLASLPCMMW